MEDVEIEIKMDKKEGRKGGRKEKEREKKQYVNIEVKKEQVCFFLRNSLKRKKAYVSF